MEWNTDSTDNGGRRCHVFLRHSGWYGRAFTVLLLLALLSACGKSATPLDGNSPASGQSGIVAGSSHLANVIADVTGAPAVPYALVPPALCPSHFDVKPEDVGRLTDPEAVLVHPWQMAMGNISRALDAARTPKERVHVVDVPGNWMVPETQAAALRAVCEVLSRLHPEKAAQYHAAAETRAAAVLAHGAAVKARLEAAGTTGIPVAVSEMQAPFLAWAGFGITVTFGRAEDLGAEAMSRLIGAARSAGTRLVVNNLQSGDPRAGETLAAELKVPMVTISNFPGSDPALSTWEALLDENVRLLMEATGLKIGP